MTETIDPMTGSAGAPPPVPPPLSGSADQPQGDAPAAVPADEPNPRRTIISLSIIGVLMVLMVRNWGVGALVIALGLLISVFLHEMGHFLAAKQAGMKVTEYFFGFGPKLFSFRRGETEYGFKAIPAGAYVRIIGMNTTEEVDPADEDRTYRQKGYAKRLRVVLAGPAMNLTLAFVLLFAWFAGLGVPTATDWKVHTVVEGSAAADAGILPGDRVVGIAGQQTADFDAITSIVQDHAGKPVDVQVMRDGQVLDLKATIGWKLTAEAAAAIAPLEAEDLVRTVNGQPVADYDQFVQAIRQSQGQPTAVTFERAGHDWRTEVTVPDAGALPERGASGFLGIRRDSTTVRQGPWQAAKNAGHQFTDMAGASLSGLGRFFSPSGFSHYAKLVFTTAPNAGTSPAAEPSGAPAIEPVDPGTTTKSAPVTVAANPADDTRVLSMLGVLRLGGQAGAEGFGAVLGLLALVNLFLGMINLVPLPPFDGGHAAVATYEAVRGAVTHRPYRANMARLMPVAYAVVIIFVFIGLSSFYLDAIHPAQNPFGR